MHGLPCTTLGGYVDAIVTPSMTASLAVPIWQTAPDMSGLASLTNF